MPQKVLVTCSTPYQLLVATQVVSTFFPSFQADLIITDQMNDSKEIYNQCLHHGWWHNVFYLKEKQLNALPMKEKLKGLYASYTSSEKHLRQFIQLHETYDVFLYANLSLMNQYLARCLKGRNKGLCCEIFEDGAMTYAAMFGKLLYSASPKIRLQLSQIQNPHTMYLFSPQSLAYQPTCPVKKIPSAYSWKDLQVLDQIFHYQEEGYDTPALFFEESYFCDGISIGDIALVERAVKPIGKENLFVKIHPRNPENRFAAEGYKTNHCLSTPWELIILHHSFENTLFLTIGSSAATNPYTIFGMPVKTIFLCELVENKENLRQQILDQTKAICTGRPDLFFFPKSWEEYDALVDQLIHT